MAKFSQTFLQSMLQPSYQEGLFTAARQAAGLPGKMQEQKNQGTIQSSLFQLEQKAMAGTLTPEEYQKAIASYSKITQTNPELAEEIRSSLSRVGSAMGSKQKATDQNRVRSEVANLRQAALAVQSNKSRLDPEQKRQTLAKMKTEFNRIKEANPTIDLSSFEGMFEDVVVEAAQLDRINQEAADDAAVQTFSNQLFQVKDFDSLETTTESLLKANPEYAEDIKRLSQVMQRSIENTQARERARVERQFDITGDVNDLRKNIQTLPERLKTMVESELAIAEQLQNQYRNDTGWVNEPAKNRAEAAIKKAESLVDRYALNNVQEDSRTIRGIDNDLEELARRGPVIPKESEIEDTAEAMALQKNKDYSRLPVAQKAKFYEQARKELKDRNLSMYDRDITVLERRRASITGEVIEEVTEPPKPKFLEPISKEAVEAARANGQSDAQIRRTFQNMGVSNAKIIGLLFD